MQLPNGVTAITGTVTEISSYTSHPTKGVDVYNIYSFVTIEEENGDIVRVGNVITNPDVDMEIKVGNKATFYFVKFRTFSEFRKIKNILAGTQSDRGVALNTIPKGGDLISIIPAAVIMIPVLMLFGALTAGWIFAERNNDMAFLVSTWPVILAAYFPISMLRARHDAMAVRRFLSRLSSHSAAGRKLRTI